MNAKDLARKLVEDSPKARPAEVRKAAEEISSDPKFVDVVIQEYFAIKARQKEFGASVERNWSEDRGY